MRWERRKSHCLHLTALWRTKPGGRKRNTDFQVAENDSETCFLSSLTNSVYMLWGLWNLMETEYAEASIRQSATLGCVG